MNNFAKDIILLGSALIVVGLVVLLFQKVRFLGKLPATS